jgi:hypothetical protein
VLIAGAGVTERARATGASGTAPNWATVTKLLALLDASSAVLVYGAGLPVLVDVKNTSFLVTLLACGLVLVPACGQDSRELDRYTARLRAINDSGVSGTASLNLVGDRLLVEIDAEEMVPDRIHPQNLFAGNGEQGRARCPTAAADADGSGLVTPVEVQDAFGPGAVPLEPFPTVGSDGELAYRLTSELEPGKLEKLDGRVLVLHGLGGGRSEGAPADGYEPGMPVACGRLAPARP